MPGIVPWQAIISQSSVVFKEFLPLCTARGTAFVTIATQMNAERAFIKTKGLFSYLRNGKFILTWTRQGPVRTTLRPGKMQHRDVFTSVADGLGLSAPNVFFVRPKHEAVSINRERTSIFSVLLPDEVPASTPYSRACALEVVGCRSSALYMTGSSID